jgi:hypothetical protein
MGAFVAAVATAFLHIPGLHGWYMQYWWYDIFMHILGGIAIGLLLASIARIFSWKPRRILWYIIIGTFCVGLAWEYFEIYFRLTGHPIGSRPYYIDTVLDIIDDIIGGCIAAFLFTKFGR